MFDLSELPLRSGSTETTPPSRTFSDIIEELEDLPSRRTTEELEWAVNEVLFSGEDDACFQDAWITTRPVKDTEIEDTVVRDDRKMHRLVCDITGVPFYLPAGSLVPIVVFKTSHENGSNEPWTERIHPELVESGPEDVMQALISSYVRNKLLDAGAELIWALQQLNLLREMETLDGGWPDFDSTKAPAGYDADHPRLFPGWI